MPDYKAWEELGQAIGSGSEAYRKAKAAKAAAMRQAEQDAMAKQGFDLKMSEETPALPNPFGGPAQLTRSEAVSAQMKKAELENARKLAGLKQPGMGKPTTGETAVDRAYAKDYLEWTQAGAPDVEGQLGNLKSAMDTLKSGENVTGPVIGMLPGPLQSVFNKTGKNVASQVADVVQRSLRPILGSQFTEKEGKLIIQNAYDPTLPEEVNADRVGRLITKIQQMAQAKTEMANYFQENGTLKGYKGRQPSLADLNEFRGTSGAQKSIGPQVGDIQDGFRFKGGNPSDPNAWEQVQ